VSKVHYFQRYSSLENAVTNNTLQLFNRIYGHSPRAASAFLFDLTGESLEIGVNVKQQESGAGSVPDASISQESFKVLVETKVDAPFSEDQIIRHAAAFQNESKKILLLLSKRPLAPTEEAQVQRNLAERHAGVTFRSVTFKDVCRAARDRFAAHEDEMQALVDDFEEYCATTGLLDDSRVMMRVVPCGNSADLNVRHAMYFQPSERGYAPHAFIGIYKDKTVRALLEIDSVFDVNLKDGRLEKILVQGRETDEHDARILAMIAEARVDCGYELETRHRFFCARAAVETDYRKASRGGIMGARLVNLKEKIGAFSSVTEAAQKLRGKTWDNGANTAES
jgi:hypothetical protein